LNPRRPTPSGPQPRIHDPSKSASKVKVNYSTSAPIKDNDLLGKFLSWCIGKGTSEATCRQYTRYLGKPLDMDNKWSRLAWKAFFKFTGREDLWKRIKVKKSGVDLYIPSDKEVVRALRKACSSSTELSWIYKLLIYSGLRLEEAVKIVNESEETKWIKLDSFYKYPLSWKRGSKQALYCYTIEKPPKLHVSSKWISNWASKNKALAPKYLRKWTATKMLALGIPEETVNFIQGRIPQKTLSKHYLKLTTLADQYYKKYVEWLRENILAKL